MLAKVTHPDEPRLGSIAGPFHGKLAAVMAAINNGVRPGLAWLFSLAIIAMIMLGIPVPDAMWGLAGTVIAFFFTSREAERSQERLELQHEQLVDLARQLPPERPT